MPAITGEVVELDGNRRTPTFEWTIRDFSELKYVFYRSPSVTYFNNKWWISVHLTADSIEGVWLKTESRAPGEKEYFNISLKCVTCDGKERDVALQQTFPEDGVEWRRIIDPPWKISRKAKVTFTCTLRKVESPHAPVVSRETQTEDIGFPIVSRETQTEDIGFPDISILSEEFRKLLLSGTGHDVRLKVGDKLFRAHKCVLQARSTVFAAMFSNEMAESADDSVTIEDCDPDAFGPFLQFVYSGKMDIPSVRSALGLYYAGDKYDVPRLKEISVEFMKVSFTATTVFDVISLAARHDEEELLKQAIVYFANHLQEVLRTVEWQRFLLANPIQANEMYLKAAECLVSSF